MLCCVVTRHTADGAAGWARLPKETMTADKKSSDWSEPLQIRAPSKVDSAV